MNDPKNVAHVRFRAGHAATEWESEPHDWHFDDIGDGEWLDTLGRRNNNGRTFWMAVVCSHHTCPARVLVREGWFTEMFAAYLPRVLPKLKTVHA